MNWLYICLLAVVSFGFGGCSDDDDEVTVPVFPTEQTINANEDGTATLSFTANMDWQLSSGATWCKFVNNGEEVSDMSGTAGSITVNIKVEENTALLEDETKLTLRMGGQDQVIAIVKRPGAERTLQIIKVTENEDGTTSEETVTAIEIGYGSYNTYKVTANFGFVASFPEYVNLEGDAETVVGEANQEVEIKVRMSYESGDQIKYPITETDGAKATFVDATDQQTEMTVIVTYPGMDPNVLNLISDVPAYGWVISMDGETYATTDMNTQKLVKWDDNKIECTVQCFNDDFEILVTRAEYPQYGMPYSLPYEDEIFSVKATKGENGNITVTADDSDPMYSAGNIGYRIFALPRAVYQEMVKLNESEEEEDKFTDEWNSITDKAMETLMNEGFCILEITRDNISFGNDVKATTADGVELECEKITDYDLLNAIENRFGTREAYSVMATPGCNILYYANFSQEEWWGSVTAYLGGEETEINMSEPEFSGNTTIIPINGISEGETMIGFIGEEGYISVLVIMAYND